MEINNLVELTDDLLKRAKQIKFDLQGPAETQYGYGFPPTISIWYEDRRIHFYFDRKGVANIEAAELPNVVVCGTVLTYDQAWAVVEAFLVHKCGFDRLPDCSWQQSTADSDKFIPHPPSSPSQANIVSLLNSPGWKPWIPPHVKSANKGWVRNFLTRFFSRFRR